MVADDFGDLRICETRVLSDYGLLMVLAVKDESCRRKSVSNEPKIAVIKASKLRILGKLRNSSQGAIKNMVLVPFLGRGTFGSG